MSRLDRSFKDRITTHTSKRSDNVHNPSMRPRTLLALAATTAAIVAGGALPSSALAERGIESFTTSTSTSVAGAHPDVTTDVLFNGTDEFHPEGEPQTVTISLPAGLIGNPSAVPQCSQATIDSIGGATQPVAVMQACGVATQIGTARIKAVLDTNGVPSFVDSDAAVLNIQPGPDQPARLFVVLGGLSFLAQPIFIDVTARTESDFGIDTFSAEVNGVYFLRGVSVTIWGVPGAHTRGGPMENCNASGTCTSTTSVPALPPDPVSEQKAFMTNPTVCDAPKVTKLDVTYREDPDTHITQTSSDPTPTDCESVPFNPSFELTPTSTVFDGPSGLDVDLSVPQSNSPSGVGSSHLRRAEVTLPEGVSVNPAAADGLVGCSDAQFKQFTRLAAECPLASKIGTVDYDVPLLPGNLTGDLYLGEPKSTDPQSTEMFRIFQYAHGFGQHVKLAGYAKADPVTGRLTAVFDELPQVPFSNATLHFKGGDRGILAMPQDCGTKTTTAKLTPWSGNAPSVIESTFDVGGACDLGFAPALSAGMSTSTARASGNFSFAFSRPDGQQWIKGLTATLPTGLLANVKGVPLCSNAAADAGACPAGSRIGSVVAAGGSGSPFYLPNPGTAYLTEGYKGCAYGLAIVVPVEAGPFTGDVSLGNIVVRQKVCVDPTDARVTAISDPLPTIWHGIPLRVRDVRVTIDRDKFMVNPSDCSAKQVGGRFTSDRGTSVDVAQRFQATGCAGLPFKPAIGLNLTGPRQVTTGKHPGVKATVTQAGAGEAGIKQAIVRLPKSLALDPDNAQALCEFEDGIKSDLENHCPAGSIVGRARAKTPLLNNDLVGNVYFVKNVRKDPKTGNLIRTLPMLIVALRGEIAVNLRGESSTTGGGKLVNTFATVPDAPITQFNLNIKGGPNGILAVTRTRKAKINLCASRQTAEADTDAQNGRRHDFDIRIKTPCTKQQVKKAKRAAKKAAKARS